MKSIILLLGIIFPALFPLCHGFIASSPIGIRMGHVDTTYTSLQPIPKAPTLLPMIPESNFRKSSATAAAAAASEQQESPARALSVAHSARDALRQITGFSLTAARTALRAATGLSLTAIYAASVAASGLWLRKSTAFLISFVPLSVRWNSQHTFISIFDLMPFWHSFVCDCSVLVLFFLKSLVLLQLRVFFQPFLIAYYVPILAVRAYTGPVRKEALARHLATLKAWEEAFRYASQHVDNVFENGYAPMRFDSKFLFLIEMRGSPLL